MRLMKLIQTRLVRRFREIAFFVQKGKDAERFLCF